MGSWWTGLLARAVGAEGVPALLILKKSLALGRGMGWLVAPFSTNPAHRGVLVSWLVTEGVLDDGHKRRVADKVGIKCCLPAACCLTQLTHPCHA